MKINVAKSNKQIGDVFPFHYTVSGEQLGLESDASWEKSSIIVDGEVVNNGQHLEVRGLIKSTGCFVCSRCLDAMSCGLEVPFSERFLAEGLESDNEDIVFYSGDEIDIQDLIRESLLLAEPLTPVCKEECQGLCPVCGMNLNAATCSCDRTPIDPRLAVLTKLLFKSEDKAK